VTLETVFCLLFLETKVSYLFILLIPLEVTEFKFEHVDNHTLDGFELFYMKMKHFLISLLITIITTIIFTLPGGDTMGLLMPTILFSGVAGGIYIGYMRKRPLISCFYDGFIVGMVAGFLQIFVVLPILWYYHNLRLEVSTPIRFIFMIALACVMLTGLAGGPIGGLVIGLFYRYVQKDRGETDLYESYLDDKMNPDDRKSDLMK